MIILTQECDLQWDFAARFTSTESKSDYSTQAKEIDTDRSCVSHIVMCDVYEEATIRSYLIKGSEIWKRVRQNQDERYHRLPPHHVSEQTAEEGDNTYAEVAYSDLFIDFKRALALPTRQLYEGLSHSLIPRHGIVPPIYLHDLLHRAHGYWSRVALPEEQKTLPAVIADIN